MALEKLKSKIINAVVVADTAQRELRHEKRAQRLPILLGEAKPTCESCNNFSLKEGQEFVATHPTFSRIAGAMTPEQLGLSSKGELASQELTRPITTNWYAYGHCKVLKSLTHKTSWCGVRGPGGWE